MLAYGKLSRDLMGHGKDGQGGGDYIGLEFSGKVCLCYCITCIFRYQIISGGGDLLYDLQRRHAKTGLARSLGHSVISKFERRRAGTFNLRQSETIVVAGM